MELQRIREQLYKRYIDPTKPKRPGYIGVEIEMPVVNFSKKPVDFQVIHTVTENFISQYNFLVVGKDDEGNIFSAQSPVNGDILSYDCSYNNLELSFGREQNLFTIQNRFSEYYDFLQNEFKKYNYTLTGMGVNPYRNYNHNVPIPNGRYRMLFHHLNSYKRYLDMPMYFHSYPEYGTFSSASQVQLDVEYDRLVLTLNTFSKLEPIKALLFSNSILPDLDENTLCCRDMFWENSTHGINPHNVGMYDCEFESVDDIVSYIETTSIYCLERNGKYINFPPIKLDEYFNRPSVTGEYFDNGIYREVEVEPCFEDLEYLRTFKFIDLTFRGTVEFRSVCCQPISDSLCVAAFHLGLMDKLQELSDLLENDRILFRHGYTSGELRKLLIKRDLPEFIDRDRLYSLAKEVVDLAYEGLLNRGLGEEKLLEPLYQRISHRTNPAKRMLDLKNRGVKTEDIIEEYAKN
ncbi:MAG: glutamylcysteine synthetase [Ruminococcus sp.]